MKIIRYVVAPVLTAGTLAANFVTTPAVAVTRPIPIPARFGTATTPGTHVTVVMHEGMPSWVFGVVAGTYSRAARCGRRAFAVAEQQARTEHYCANCDAQVGCIAAAGRPIRDEVDHAAGTARSRPVVQAEPIQDVAGPPADDQPAA